jgi:hypothetical protein
MTTDASMELSGPNAGVWTHEPPTGTFERLAKSATGWGAVVCDLTLWGLRNKGADGHNRMPEAYDKLIAAAHEWQQSPAVIQGFVQAKAIVLKMRQASDSRSKFRGIPKRQWGGHGNDRTTARDQAEADHQPTDAG